MACFRGILHRTVKTYPEAPALPPEIGPFRINAGHKPTDTFLLPDHIADQADGIQMVLIHMADDPLFGFGELFKTGQIEQHILTLNPMDITKPGHNMDPADRHSIKLEIRK